MLYYFKRFSLTLNFVCLLAFLSENPEIHPVLGEKVACAAVSLHLYILLYIQVQCYLPLLQLHFSFKRFQLCHMRLRTQQTFCYRHNILVRDSEMPIVTM